MGAHLISWGPLYVVHIIVIIMMMIIVIIIIHFIKIVTGDLSHLISWGPLYVVHIIVIIIIKSKKVHLITIIIDIIQLEAIAVLLCTSRSSPSF